MQQGAGSLFLGSVVYGLGLSIGLAVFAVAAFFVCLKIFGWWMGREARKAEKEAEAQALKDLLSNYRKNPPSP
jgi:cbb3-type cytochrome oxidase subunit 3